MEAERMGELRDALMEAASALGHAAALAAELEDGRPRHVQRSYSVAELSEATGVPRNTIWDAIRAGRVRAISVTGGPRGTRMPESDWLAFEDDARHAEVA